MLATLHWCLALRFPVARCNTAVVFGHVDLLGRLLLLALEAVQRHFE